MSEGSKVVSFADDVETGGRAGREDEHRRFLKKIAEGEGATVVGEEDGDDVPEKRPRLDDNPEEEDVPQEKHTLDSDEEEEEDHKRMDIKKVDGQEDSTLDFDGEIKITPFNMKEDEEEGHFDETGNFVFDKKKEEIKDAWLDNIDWGHIKKKAGSHWEQSNEDKDEPLPATLDDSRRKEIFRKLVDLLKPNQNIARAMADIKKSKKMTAAEERKLRWAAKKAGKPFETDDGEKATAELSALADELISAGHMDAYEWNREKVEFLLSRLESVAVDDLDMFSDEPAPSSHGTGDSGSADVAAAMDDAILWEYKESEDSEIQGPFSSEAMAKRQADGKLAPKGVARKVGTGDFNPTARIDFDLYC